MKMTLNISLLLSLGLAAALILYRWDGRKAPSMPPAVSAQTCTAIAIAPPLPVSDPPKPTPFNWSQLASADYRTYVKNLRRIGCPEPTLRAIVTADVDAKYRQRSNELEKKLDDLNNGSWTVQLGSYQDQQALKLELEKLPAAETSEINTFLGWTCATTETSPAMTATIQTAGSRPHEGIQPAGHRVFGSTSHQLANWSDVLPSQAAITAQAGPMGAELPPLIAAQLPPTPKSASLPLVFQPVDSTASSPSASEQQAVNDLRQDFIKNVNNSGQTPADPAYQQTWQEAQSQTDQMTLVQLGYNAYMQYWLAQYQKGLVAQARSSQTSSY